MRWFTMFIAIVFVAPFVRADEAAKAPLLTAKEIADGWILLFDGESTFGWKIDGEAKVENGKLILGGTKATTASVTTGFNEYSLNLRAESPDLLSHLSIAGGGVAGNRGANIQDTTVRVAVVESPIFVKVPAGSIFIIHQFRVRPLCKDNLFNGEDLTGWKPFTSDPKRAKSKFTVTTEGWLNVKNGPGDLQTEKQFDDFILQAECISNGKNLNSGIFFRCLPGQYQNGYEAQIHNGYKDGDRTKPTDYGTGAIYRRQAARKVVPYDNEWFTMTIAAHGNHMATWVNGYQVTDFTDTRSAHENPRNGSKIEKGAISIQGHDPTTDLSFRNIRIAELKKK